MINLRFTIENPFTDRFESIDVWSGSTPIEHKYWECQTMKSNDIVAFDLRYTTRRDHAGLELWLGLFGYAVNFQIYDHRHWDYDKNDWVVY